MTDVTTSGDTGRGLGFALSAYLLWGLLPIYMKWMSHIPPLEVVAHRVLWSVPIATLVLILLGRTTDVKEALRNPGMLRMACVTAALVSVNWLIYVWAIVSNRALEAALGYYINPLFSVALGAILLGEKLTRAQLAAVALAGVAVLILTIDRGTLPWVALGLTVSWGFYAYFKKQLPIGPNQGFLLEVLLLCPVAAIYLIWLSLTGAPHFATGSGADTWLLLGCGVITAGPLLLYANGAKGLRLSTIGVLQYIVPTMIFLLAVFVFREPVGQARALAFPLIWAALVIYSWALIRDLRKPL